MSRHPPVRDINKASQQQKIAEKYVNFITETSVPKAMTLQEVKEATLTDKTMNKARELIQTGRWFEVKTIHDRDIDTDELQDLNTVRDELSCHINGVIMRGTQIVIPPKLRDKAVQIAHEGHQGINKTKAFMRSKVWFPGLNEKVETMIQGCLACQTTVPNTVKMEPLQMSNMPDGPWQNLSADFCGPFANGHYLFVITDEYSRYPVVEILKSTSANVTIPVLDKVLAQYGYPRVIKTDNGSPFNSEAFAKFANYSGFTHRRITPRWPRANAQAEAFNKPMMKAVKSAFIEGKPWRQELYHFLRQYRTTPHPSTSFTPYRLLFGRDPQTRLPEVIANCNSDTRIDHMARTRDAIAKRKMKDYADLRNNAKHSSLIPGDHVLVREEAKFSKLNPTFKVKPYTVMEKKGNMVSVSNHDHSMTRNSSYFKQTVISPKPKQETEDEIDMHDASQSQPGDTVDTTTPRHPVTPATRRSGRERRMPKKPKTQRGKRALEKKEPKVFENVKNTMIIKGGNTSMTVTQVLKELHMLKKPFAVPFKRKNITRPFEDQTSLEFFSTKSDSSLFIFGSHSKKRPDNLVIGRMFDSHVLDMVELGIDKFKSMYEFEGSKISTGCKPCLLFAGELFDNDDEYRRIKNILIDFFRGPVVTNVRLAGLEHVISIMAADEKIYIRNYRVLLKKSGSRTPYTELEEMGPSLNLTVRRSHLASADLYKKSMKVPYIAKPKKKKNISHDVFGTKLGQVHMQKQDLNKLQTRKMKGLKKSNRDETDQGPKTKKTRTDDSSGE